MKRYRFAILYVLMAVVCLAIGFWQPAWSITRNGFTQTTFGMTLVLFFVEVGLIVWLKKMFG